MSVIFTHLKNTSLSRTLCFNFLFFLSLHLSFFFFASSCKGSWRRGSWKVVYRVFDYILEIWWWIIILRCVKGVVVVILHLHVKVKLLFKCRLRWDLSLFLFFFYFCHDHLSGILPKSHKKDFFFLFPWMFTKISWVVQWKTLLVLRLSRKLIFLQLMTQNCWFLNFGKSFLVIVICCHACMD